jgi:protein TonB
VLVHLAIFELIRLIPPNKTVAAKEPTMVDLTELPTPSPHPKPVYRQAEKREREAREVRPKQPLKATTPTRSTPSPQLPGPVGQKMEPMHIPTKSGDAEPITRGEGIFRPKTKGTIDPSRLFPSAGRLASLEDKYREKYRREIEDGETKFLNTDDIQFGSFMRRLETAVYGVWRYPEAALARGIEGTTPVKITFSRDGEVVHVDLLQSSGSKILDDEVIRALKELGPIGSLPRGYRGDTFKLIAFFHYGIGGYRLH